MVSVRGFEFSRTFLTIFVMFVKLELCEAVLAISGSTMSSLQLFLLSYQSFDMKCLLLSWDAWVYRQAREW